MPSISVFDKESFLFIRLLFNPEGKACPYVILDGTYARQKTAYNSLYGDLLDVQAMIQYLKENPKAPNIVQYSMYKALITQYAKCFNNSDGRKVMLDPKKLFKTRKELLEIHKEVMDMRNNYMAHAGVGKYEYGAMVALLNPDLSKQLLVATNYAELKFMDHSRKLSGYAELCENALRYVNTKLEKLQLGFDKELESVNIEELYSKSKTPKRKDWKITNN